MDTPRRTRTYRSHHVDSERWDHVTLRPHDVVISTSMKAGTTWMQRIMSLLVFGAGRFEGGADRFFHKGTNGRWHDVLTESDLALYEAAAAELDPELRSWLEAGSAAHSASTWWQAR